MYLGLFLVAGLPVKCLLGRSFTTLPGINKREMCIPLTALHTMHEA